MDKDWVHKSEFVGFLTAGQILYMRARTDDTGWPSDSHFVRGARRLHVSPGSLQGLLDM
jgi:hypothetical protein